MFELAKTTSTVLQKTGVPFGLDEIVDRTRGITITLQQTFPLMVYVIRFRDRETYVYLDKGAVIGPKGGDRTWQSVVETVRFGAIGATWKPSAEERSELGAIIGEGIPAIWVLNHPETRHASISFTDNVIAWLKG